MPRLIEASWLAVRRGADARARQHSLPLVQRLAASLTDDDPGADLTLVDLGAGTGANQTWLAPVLDACRSSAAGRQRWHLLDHDPALLALAATLGPGSDRVSSTRHTGSVAQLPALLADLPTPVIVTCSALLDVLTAAQVDDAVAATTTCADAALWALSVTGEITVTPAHADDALVREWFNADQRRTDTSPEAAGHTLLGPTAWQYAQQQFLSHGWQVFLADTPWVLGPEDATLSTRFVTERAAAARGASTDPVTGARIERWLRDRLIDLERGSLTVRVDHVDLLALPPSTISVQTSSPNG